MFNFVDFRHSGTASFEIAISCRFQQTTVDLDGQRGTPLKETSTAEQVCVLQTIQKVALLQG